MGGGGQYNLPNCEIVSCNMKYCRSIVSYEWFLAQGVKRFTRISIFIWGFVLRIISSFKRHGGFKGSAQLGKSSTG